MAPTEAETAQTAAPKDHARCLTVCQVLPLGNPLVATMFLASQAALIQA